ncbi:MAG: tRNA uridine-5-carboxymethylaminomethyl(34) synthesis GTPase MnmE [Muribaculum sp.]|nr:tRNA uridine-5-carboxymethylaminomethyl(34) synthesis GTPase MnmE [Muribaculum sp.]
MTFNDDTICAISTAPGVGGIAVIRVSGPQSRQIVDRIWHGKRLESVASHTAHLGSIVDETGEVIDSAVATVFCSPASFTGDDVVELSVHGSAWIQRETVQLLVRQGCRIAEPGEFTRRAFAAGKLDLAEAEAVADVIASSSRAAHRMAMSQMRGEFSRRLETLRDRLLDLASLLELELDFSEEDVEFASREKLKSLADEIHGVVAKLASSFATGAALKEGVPVAIVGATNAGKSTLLNRLLGDDRAIVSDIHGTTRDIIEDRIEIDGVLFRLIDTAGLRDTTDVVESLGIDRTIKQIDKAAIVVWVIDPFTSPAILRDTWQRISRHITDSQHLIIAINKSDLTGDNLDATTVSSDVAPLPSDTTTLRISAATGTGIEALCHNLVNASGVNSWQGDILVTNSRHYEALTHALDSISRVREGLESGISGDFIAQDVRETIHHLGTITGAITTTDILTTIFSRFCIGK